MDPELLIRLGLATRPELRAMDPDDVLRIKSERAPNYRAGGAATPVLERAAIDRANRRIIYAGSVEIVDRMGDLIKQSGWDTRDWKEHGSLFIWNHNHEAPIGQGFRCWQGKANVRKEGECKALMFDIGYLQEDLSPAAEVVWRLASGDGTPTGKPMLKAVSVALLPKEMREPTEKEREELGMDRFGVIYEKQDLLELSQAPVPANQAATQVRATRSSLRQADRRLAAELDATLDAMVDAGNLGAHLVRYFREHYPLTPGLAAERAAERVRSFVDLGSWDWGGAGDENGAADGTEAATAEAPPEAPEGDAVAASATERSVTETERALLDDEEAPASESVAETPAEINPPMLDEPEPEVEREARSTSDGSVTVTLRGADVAGLRSMYRQVDGLLNTLGDLLDTVDAAERACDGGTEQRTLAPADDGTARLARALEVAIERALGRGAEPTPATPTDEPVSMEALRNAVEAITNSER